jgi:signal transduction histidine kinase
MNLRTKIILYLVLLHLALAGVALVALRENRVWLLAIEAIFLASIGLGWMLVRAFFVPLNLIRTGADLMEERDFTTHFRETGQPEMDALIGVYNRMIDRLRDERLRAEEQQQLLGKIIESSPAGVAILDFDGKIAMANPAAKRLLGGSIPSVPKGESEVMAQPDGRRLRIHHGEFFDRGFSRSFFLVEELTEELRASEKGAYEKLIRLMSHEVNNSVGAVRSLLESSLNYAGQLRPEDGADFQNALTVAIARMQNLNAFVNGFADVVRLPAPRFEPCRIDELVGDILTLLRPELESRRIVTTLSVAEDVEPVSCDKNQMEQVLLNVMRNSIETIGTSGSIGIEVTRNDLRIADSGAGIAPEVAPLLFSPFFSTKRDGRGLGLTLTQEILKQHRFDFALQNRPEGGAEFRLSFRAEAPRGS